MGQQESGSATSSIKVAVAGWWTLIGIVAASVTGFSLLRKMIDIGLARVLADLFATYERWVHAPIEWLFGWLQWPVPPAWTIDVALLWLLIGGVVLRSAWGVRRAGLENWAHDKERPFWAWLLSARVALPVFLFLTIFVWPLPALYMLQKPHMTLFRGKGVTPRRDRRNDKTFRYFCDMRIVLVTQALAAIICIGAWVAANVLLKMYE